MMMIRKKIEIVELDINPLSYAILGKDIPNFNLCLWTGKIIMMV